MLEMQPWSSKREVLTYTEDSCHGEKKGLGASGQILWVGGNTLSACPLGGGVTIVKAQTLQRPVPRPVGPWTGMQLSLRGHVST